MNLSVYDRNACGTSPLSDTGSILTAFYMPSHRQWQQGVHVLSILQLVCKQIRLLFVVVEIKIFSQVTLLKEVRIFFDVIKQLPEVS